MKFCSISTTTNGSIWLRWTLKMEVGTATCRRGVWRRVGHPATPSAQRWHQHELCRIFSKEWRDGRTHVASHERNSRHCIRGIGRLSRSCWIKVERPATGIIGNISGRAITACARPISCSASRSLIMIMAVVPEEKRSRCWPDSAVVRPPFRRDVRVGCGRQPA